MSCHPDSGPDPTLLPQSDIKSVVKEEKNESASNNKPAFFHQVLKNGHR